MCSHISTYKVVGTIIESWCLGKSQIFTIPYPFDENNLFSNQSLGQFHIFPIQRNPDTWKYKEELANTLMALTVDQILKRIGSYGWYQKRLTLIIGLMEGVNMVYQILIIVFIAAEPNWRCVTNATNCTLEGSFRPGHANYHLRCKIARDQWEFEKGFTSVVTEVNHQPYFVYDCYFSSSISIRLLFPVILYYLFFCLSPCFCFCFYCCPSVVLATVSFQTSVSIFVSVSTSSLCLCLCLCFCLSSCSCFCHLFGCFCVFCFCRCLSLILFIISFF